jgi:hypothetical protein
VRFFINDPRTYEWVREGDVEDHSGAGNLNSLPQHAVTRQHDGTPEKRYGDQG